MARKKVITNPCDLPEEQFDEWLADDSGRRGYRSVRYWDIRQKSMTPPEAEAVIKAAAGNDDEESLYIFKDYSTIGFFTQDKALAMEMLERGLDFLYDKNSGLWCFDLFGHHQIVMRSLISMYKKCDFYKYDYNEAADMYVEECYGFFNSGAASYGPPTVRMGENYNLPAEVKTKLARLGYRIWRL